MCVCVCVCVCVRVCIPAYVYINENFCYSSKSICVKNI